MSNSLVFIDHIPIQRVCGKCHTLPHLFNWPTLSNWSNYSTRTRVDSMCGLVAKLQLDKWQFQCDFNFLRFDEKEREIQSQSAGEWKR